MAEIFSIDLNAMWTTIIAFASANAITILTLVIKVIKQKAVEAKNKLDDKAIQEALIKKVVDTVSKVNDRIDSLETKMTSYIAQADENKKAEVEKSAIALQDTISEIKSVLNK